MTSSRLVRVALLITLCVAASAVPAWAALQNVRVSAVNAADNTTFSVGQKIVITWDDPAPQGQTYAVTYEAGGTSVFVAALPNGRRSIEWIIESGGDILLLPVETPDVCAACRVRVDSQIQTSTSTFVLESAVSSPFQVLPWRLFEHKGDVRPLDTRIPLILVHGIHFAGFLGFPGSGTEDTWKEFLAYFFSREELWSRYKPYVFLYESQLVPDWYAQSSLARNPPIGTIAEALKSELARVIGPSQSVGAVFLTHSLGGLVARYLFQTLTDLQDSRSTKFPIIDMGDTGRTLAVLGLITLDTPHEGVDGADIPLLLEAFFGANPSAVVDEMLPGSPLLAHLNLSLDCSSDVCRRAVSYTDRMYLYTAGAPDVFGGLPDVDLVSDSSASLSHRFLARERPFPGCSHSTIHDGICQFDGSTPLITIATDLRTLADMMAGRIIDIAGNGLPNVLVTFTALSGNQPAPAPATTNARGEWVQVGFRQSVTYLITPSDDHIAFAPQTSVPPNVLLTFTGTTPQPAATTSAASSITSSGAVLTGTVNPQGSPGWAYFEWGTDSALTAPSSTELIGVSAAKTAQPFSAPRSGLASNTTFYFRMVFRNAANNTFQKGMIATFKTLPPVVTTAAASSVTSSGAVLAGTVNPQGSPGWAYFEWGTDSALTAPSSTELIGVSVTKTVQSFSAPRSGLASNTAFYFRMVFRNAANNTFQKGVIVTFKTLQPAVTTLAASSITSSSGVLTGTVNPQGSPGWAYFEWGTDSALTTPSSTGLIGVSPTKTVQPFSAPRSGLASNTTFYFRMVFRNAANGAYQKGLVVGFVTP